MPDPGLVFNLEFELFLLGPKRVSTCDVPIVFRMTTFSSQIITFFTAWTSPKTKLGIYVIPAENFIIYCHPQFLPLGGAIIKESTFCQVQNLISTCSLNCAESRHIGHAHFRPPFFFSANLRNFANLLFRTPHRRFHWFAWSFAHSICGPSWQNVIKIIFIFQTILKLLHNFLYI